MSLEPDGICQKGVKRAVRSANPEFANIKTRSSLLKCWPRKSCFSSLPVPITSVIPPGIFSLISRRERLEYEKTSIYSPTK